VLYKKEEMLKAARSFFHIDHIGELMPVEIPDVTREELARFLSVVGANNGVEVGVGNGRFSAILCQYMSKLSLFGIDPYTAYDEYHDYPDQDSLDSLQQEARLQLSSHSNYTFMPYTSLEASSHFQPSSLDFVYIDANHRLEYMVQDLALWSLRVRPGGIVAGHDFLRSRQKPNIHVVQAVEAYTDAYNIRPWFVLGRTSDAPSATREYYRSFFWIKE